MARTILDLHLSTADEAIVRNISQLVVIGRPEAAAAVAVTFVKKAPVRAARWRMGAIIRSIREVA